MNLKFQKFSTPLDDFIFLCQYLRHAEKESWVSVQGDSSAHTKAKAKIFTIISKLEIKVQ